MGHVALPVNFTFNVVSASNNVNLLVLPDISAICSANDMQIYDLGTPT
jgi:hypothetical protein